MGNSIIPAYTNLTNIINQSESPNFSQSGGGGYTTDILAALNKEDFSYGVQKIGLIDRKVILRMSSKGNLSALKLTFKVESLNWTLTIVP